MAKKIEIIEKALVITDTISSLVENEFPQGDVFFDSIQLTDGTVRLYDTSGVNPSSSGIFTEELINCVDSTDTPFTEATFRDFARVSLGFNAAASGGAGTLKETLTNGNVTGNDQTIDAENGGGQLSLRIGSDGTWGVTSDSGAFAQSFVSGNPTIMQTGFGSSNIFEADATEVKMKVAPAATDFASIDACEIKVGKGVALAADPNPLKVFRTDGGAGSIVLSSGNKILALGSSAFSYVANITRSVVLAVSGGTVKTDNTAYVSQLGYINDGDAFELLIDRENLTGDEKLTFPAKTDTVATLGDITALTTKSGFKAGGDFAGNPKKVSVAFNTAFPNANYSVSVIGINNRIWTIENVAAGGFDINANANPVLAGNVYWTAIAHGES